MAGASGHHTYSQHYAPQGVWNQGENLRSSATTEHRSDFSRSCLTTTSSSAPNGFEFALAWHAHALCIVSFRPVLQTISNHQDGSNTKESPFMMHLPRISCHTAARSSVILRRHSFMDLFLCIVSTACLGRRPASHSIS